MSPTTTTTTTTTKVSCRVALDRPQGLCHPSPLDPQTGETHSQSSERVKIFFNKLPTPYPASMSLIPIDVLHLLHLHHAKLMLHLANVPVCMHINTYDFFPLCAAAGDVVMVTLDRFHRIYVS